MKRRVEQLANKEYDLVVIGGGIFGACAAWDAVLRGLSVALIEKDDFCQATSANHFKMIHGGMRYLQHLDLKRVRESCRERSILMKTAPHLATPLPILMPTYGHGLKGKEILRTGLLVYELITADRNKGISDPERHIPKSSFLTKNEVLAEYPGIDDTGLTGAVVFHDGQIYNPPRLVLSYIRAAVNEGADAANYLEAVDYILDRNRVKGVVAHDRLSGNQVEIRGKFVLNACGPWAHRLNEKILRRRAMRPPAFSRDLVMVVPKQLSKKYAFAHIVKSRDTDAVFDRGGRHIFIIPWRGYSLIGVWHQVCDKKPEDITVNSRELQQFLDDVNHVYDAVELTLDDISFINTGLILFGTQEDQGGKTDHSFGKRSMVIDHREENNIDGLVTLIGVRATVARRDAQKVLDVIIKRLNKTAKVSKTSTMPIFGGDFDKFDDLVRQAEQRFRQANGVGVMRTLIHNYGSAYTEVLKYGSEDPSLTKTIDGSSVIRAEVIHAVREEMAVTLQDVVFRRTDLGTGADPGHTAITTSADLMANELGWARQKKEDEINEVADILSRRGPWRFA
jgi:glycerol-3-phosphate dehydrogenase